MNEAELEKLLIEKLTNLKYTYRPDIKDKKSLEANFKTKFEELNRVHLSESEFSRLKDEIISPDVFKTSKMLRSINTFQRDDSTPLQYSLVNTKEWCKNDYEIINQLRINTEYSNQRYDVILLINGIPMVQIELKNLDITPRKAMQQIVDYKTESGNGYTNSLLCFMQLFIASNRSQTYYFANNSKHHFSFNADEQFLPVYQFAGPDNKKINKLDEFANEFLTKCTLGEMISKYMVLVESEQKLLIMRPYQIYAVQAIVECIKQNRGNGYIWHTTGSGKTLTSFKASTILKDNQDIEKCLFVVDRKDLDRQTREEFNKFQEGCVEENTNTEILVKRLLSNDYADKVIVTTIQKLGLALDGTNKKNYKERLEVLSNKRIVFIFDECHRSQFGDNHKAIKEFFPNAQLFGFTGTPIFDDNATYKKVNGEEASYKTTVDIFEKQLHAYTITHAIEDKNVLKFHIDFYKPDGVVTIGSTVHRIAVVEAILNKHDAVTNNRKFNAVLACSNINEAIETYSIFKERQQDRLDNNRDYVPLNVACVFSPPALAVAKDNEQNAKNVADIKQLQEDLEQEKADNQENPEEKKKALISIIEDYNKQYNTSHTINEFDSYYQDIQRRIKLQSLSNVDYAHKNKIDVVIVVDMLLTGFDSKYLNTLYVDKNLKYHGLIQAFSRTNRVLNDSKPNGNILDFRQQKDAVNDAIALFSGEDTGRAREIWLVDPAPKVIEKYEKAIEDLNQLLVSHGLNTAPEEVFNLKGDQARGEFINRFKEVQRLRTQLDQYTDISEEQASKIETLLPSEDLRSFKSVYLETAKKLKVEIEKQGDKASETLQQLDFEFVLFASAVIDYDYIMGLISEYTQKKPSRQKMTREQLVGLLSSSANLMDEKEDIIAFISSLNTESSLNEQEIKRGYELFKAEKTDKDLAEIARKHELDFASLKTFVMDMVSRLIFDGDKLSELMEPLNLGWKAKTQKELALMDDLVPVLKKLAKGFEIAGLTAYE